MSSPTEEASPQMGRDIMLSYRKLLDFESKMIAVDSKLDAVLALKGTVTDHELRLVALEQLQAIVIARQSVWGNIRTFTYGLLSAVLAGGGMLLLPKLWGG